MKTIKNYFLSLCLVIAMPPAAAIAVRINGAQFHPTGTTNEGGKAIAEIAVVFKNHNADHALKLRIKYGLIL